MKYRFMDSVNSQKGVLGVLSISETIPALGQSCGTEKVGYVLKRYPRYSETFVVNEILAHEAAGLNIEIFSLYPPNDTHFQDVISRVRAPVTYLTAYGLKADSLWQAIKETARVIPDISRKLEAAATEDVREVYQALLLAVEVRSRGITHLHAHFGNVATAVARLASHFAGTPYSFTAHAKDIFHDEVQYDDLKRKLIGASSVVTVSDYNMHFLRETYGPAAERVVRIYNGLDLDSFQYSAPLERLPLVVGVGRLVEKKGFDVLVDACAHLAEWGVDFRCLIVGNGECEDAIRSQVALLGLDGRVEMAGPKPQREIAELVSGAAVFAAPCVVGSDGNRDGLPTVLLEAMALGTPCISTDVTGIPEVLQEGITGLMVPQHDPLALANAIAHLLGDANLRVRLAGNARRLIEEEFDAHQNAARVRSHFGAALPRGSSLAGGARS
jgi:glycosyltransferase involved in cell wall biosynthesis